MSVVAFAARRPIATQIVTSAPVALLWLLFAAANLSNWQSTHRPIGLGATALELIVAALFIVRRSPWVVSRSPRAWLAAGIGTFGMLAARPAYQPVGGLELLFSGLQVAGAILAGVAVISLGRSFGIVAANRGIRTRGPYRFVRHPLYSAYALTETAYIFENPSLRNVCLYVAVMACQIIRIVEEERTLTQDPAYREYAATVRSRIVPYVF